MPTEEGVNRELYGNFQTAIASTRNYDVYWLGRSFEAGGLTYEGPQSNAPSGSDRIGAGINGPTVDSLRMSYEAPACNACTGIELALFSRGTFGTRTERPTLTVKQTDVGGQRAELWTSRYSPGGDVAGWSLVIDYGGTVVEATAGPFTQTLKDGTVVKMDEATFLAAMQNLSAYPQP